jgi:hypothetical protein
MAVNCIVALVTAEGAGGETVTELTIEAADELPDVAELLDGGTIAMQPAVQSTPNATVADAMLDRELITIGSSLDADCSL